MADTNKLLARILPRDVEIEIRDGESVLDAALRQGLNLPHSCRGGSCMACKARLESGEVAYPGGTLPRGLSRVESDKGLALLCQAQALTSLVVHARENELADDVRIRRVPCRVARMDRLTDDVMVLHLKLPKVEPLSYRAGQYLDVILRDGRRRSFSIANPPHDSELLELHIRHVPGGEFTGQVFNSMQERSLLRIEGPLGNFYLREDSQSPVIMIAGGTGWAPIKAMLSHARYIGAPRPISVYWGVRRRPDAYEREWLEEWQNPAAGRIFNLALSESDTCADANCRVGLVHQMVMADFDDLSDFDIYASGPPPMVEAIQQDFTTLGARADRLFYDSFEYAPDVLAAMRDLPDL